jgi:uncharacterized protein (DUF1778 family)
MPRPAIETNSRIALRLRSAEKARILRAVAIEQTDLTDFIRRNALRAADLVIDKAERIVLSERDSLQVLALLENPPPPSAKLVAAAKALPPEA